MGNAAARGRSRWYLKGLFTLSLLTIGLEIVRFVARSIKGEKALRR